VNLQLGGTTLWFMKLVTYSPTRFSSSPQMVDNCLLLSLTSGSMSHLAGPSGAGDVGSGPIIPLAMQVIFVQAEAKSNSFKARLSMCLGSTH
jgi:hypothetical protein